MAENGIPSVISNWVSLVLSVGAIVSAIAVAWGTIRQKLQNVAENQRRVEKDLERIRAEKLDKAVFDAFLVQAATSATRIEAQLVRIEVKLDKDRTVTS